MNLSETYRSSSRLCSLLDVEGSESASESSEAPSGGRDKRISIGKQR